MNLPESVSQSALLERTGGIYADVQRDRRVLPDRVCSLIEKIKEGLVRPWADLMELYSYANPIVAWYFDQGFQEVPLHEAVSGLAVDIVKMFDIEKILSQVQLILDRPDAPEFLPGIYSIFKSLRMAFTPDGRIDPVRYDDLARQLRRLTAPHRPYLGKNIDRAIFYI